MDAKEAVAALGALAQDTRLQVFRMLVEQGPDGLPAGVIAEKAGVPPSSLTFHLQLLLRAGLVTQRRMSRHLIYAAVPATMDGLLAYLSETLSGEGLRPGQGAAPSARKTRPDRSQAGKP